MAEVREKSPLRSFAAGTCAGFISSMVCAPLDVVKVRMQVTSGENILRGGIASSLRSIYVNEGIRGCYRGLSMALCTSPIYWGTYWPMYNSIKRHLSPIVRGYCPGADIGVMVVHMTSAVVAEAVVCTLTNPLWVIRTRLQTLSLHETLVTAQSSARSISGGVSHSQETEISATLRIISQIYGSEGMRGFYKGLLSSYCGLTHVAIQFPLYEKLKLIAGREHGNNQLPHTLVALSACTSKCIASLITYPIEVVRARQQDYCMDRSVGAEGDAGGRQRTAPSIRQLVRTLYQEGGLAAFWSGFQLSVVRYLKLIAAF